MEISVVIPLYNKINSIQMAIDSALRQTYAPREIIIVNDGSDDGSELIVEKYSNAEIILVNQENSGVSSARNRGVELANFKWVAFLDADDVWEENFLSEVVNLNSKFPEADVLATSYRFEFADRNREEIILNKIPFKSQLGLLSNYFVVASCSHPPICSSAVVVKREALMDIGGFPLGLKSGEDLVVWAKLATKYKIAYSKKVCATYIHQAENSGVSFKRESKEDPVGEILLKLRDAVSDKKIKSGLERYIGRWYKSKSIILLEIGQNSAARSKLKQAFFFSDEKVKLTVFMLISFMPSSLSKFILRK